MSLKVRWPIALVAASLAATPWTPKALGQSAAPETAGSRFEGFNRAPGFRAEGWELRPSAEARAGFTSNAGFSATNPIESPTLALRGRISAVRDLGPDQLDIDAEAEQEWVPEAPEEDQFSASLALRGRVYAGGELTLRGAAAAETGADADNASDEGIFTAGGLDPYVGRPQYFRAPVELGASQDLGSWFFDAALRATFAHYDPLTTESGVTVAQDFRNGWDGTAEATLGFRFSDGYGAIGRLTATQRRYDDPTADNQGWRAEAGVRFELTRLLTGEATAGWATQSYDASGTTESAMVYGVALTWFANPLLSITVDAKRDFQAEQDIDGAATVVTIPVQRDSAGVRAELEALRSWLLTAAVRMDRNSSVNGVRDNELTQYSLGSVYALSAAWRLSAEYAHTAATASASGDIKRDAMTVGLQAAY
jgi:hypothetical protein